MIKPELEFVYEAEGNLARPFPSAKRPMARGGLSRFLRVGAWRGR